MIMNIISYLSFTVLIFIPHINNQLNCLFTGPMYIQVLCYNVSVFLFIYIIGRIDGAHAKKTKVGQKSRSNTSTKLYMHLYIVQCILAGTLIIVLYFMHACQHACDLCNLAMVLLKSIFV